MRGSGGDGDGVRAALLYPNSQEVRRPNDASVVGQAAVEMEEDVVPVVASRARGVLLKRDARHWEGHCLDCCSRAGDNGLWIFLLTCLFPCLTVGFTQYRLHGSMTKGTYCGMLFCLFFCFYGYLVFLYILNVISGDCFFEKCDATFYIVFLIPFFLLVVFWIIGVAIATRTRMQMRKSLKIHGSNVGFEDSTACEDCMLWVLFPKCAACQEARTLAYNNVLNGVWNGPDTKNLYYHTTSGPTTCYDESDVENPTV